MGLFDKLLNRLQREEKPEEERIEKEVALKDIIFDWFNENNEPVDQFVSEFLNPIMDILKNDEKVKQYYQQYISLANEAAFNRFSIFYLAAKYPSHRKFKILFDYITDNNKNMYVIRDGIRQFIRWNKEDQNSMKYFNVIKAGKTNLEIYHAVYDNRDGNISSLVSLPAKLKETLHVGAHPIFSMVYPYLSTCDFPEKLYVLSSSMVSDTNIEFEKESLSVLRNDVNQLLHKQNENNEIKISEDLVRDYENVILRIPMTETFLNTDRKKKRYLSLKNFPDATSFIQKYEGQEVSVLKYLVYQLGLSYIPRELNKFYKEFVKELLAKTKISDQEVVQIVSQNITMNAELIFNDILAPAFAKASSAGDNSEELLDAFESQLYLRLQYIQSFRKFQDIFEVIKSKRGKLNDPIAHSLMLAKYNHLYGLVNFMYNNIYLHISDKKHGDKIFELLLSRLNKIFPSSLKYLTKHIQYSQEDHKMATLNLDGVDYDFTNNIFIELNKVLEEKKTGYRFLPILLGKSSASAQEAVQEKCSIELLNYDQFLHYQQLVLKEGDYPNNLFMKRIVYHKTDAPILLQDATIEKVLSERKTFSSDSRWKWFKDDYVDKLESSSKWYEIMDLLSECKGGSKPNKQWAAQISQAIDDFGVDRYFKELSSMMTGSLKESFWFLDQYAMTIKGIVWSCVLRPTEEALSMLKMITEAAYTKIPGIGPKATKLGNLALNAFVLSGKDEAFGMLNLMRNKSKYARFVKAIDKAIDKFLETTTGDPELLADKAIPRFGFNGGLKVTQIDDKLSVIYSIKNMKLSKKWIVDGKTQSSTPTIVKEKYSSYEKEISAEFKNINAIYKQLKERIKTYWLYDRKWHLSEWIEHIIGHPLLESYLVQMIWTNETIGKSFIYTNAKFLDNEGKEFTCGKDDIISLWHPISASKSELKSWQKYIFDNKIVQAVRQAFREHYPFLESELQLSESERFAHHFLAVKKLMAIAASAGWVFTYAHEEQSWPRKFIKALGVTAHMSCDYNRNDYAIPTKTIYFEKGNTVKLEYNRKNTKIAFSEIPEKTRSEICRDMDLFIATTSIANDPELSLKTEAEKFYREDFNKGLFSDNATAKVRKQVIEVIAPSLGINPVFEKNYLLVEGELKKYRVNLGSGFAQLAESQTHVNLLPDITPLKKSKKVHAPIQDDETLYIILAKAKLLLNDDKITDQKFITAISG